MKIFFNTFILGLFLLNTNYAIANDDISFFEPTGNTLTSGPGVDGGGTGDPDPEPTAPIDDYIPMLLVAGIGVIYIYRKKIVQLQ